MLSMFESLRIFGLLLYKSWLVRKRHWPVTLFVEILIPAGIVAFVWSISSPQKETAPTEDTHRNYHYPPISLDAMLALVPADTQTPIFYAPNNAFASELMAKVQECFKTPLDFKGFASESDFDKYVLANISRMYGNTVVVILDESIDRSAKRLSYKLRYFRESLDINKQAGALYNDEDSPTTIPSFRHYADRNHLAQTQICVDRSFTSMKSGNKPVPDTFVQRAPYAAHVRHIPFNDVFRATFRSEITSAYGISLLVETFRATKERFTGVNVLMQINGVSNALNVFSWILSGLLLLGVTVVMLILYMLTHSPGARLPLLYYGNPLLLFLALIFNLAHLLAYGVHVTAYFSKPRVGLCVLVILYVVVSNLQEYVFNESTRYITPYLGVLFPDLLLAHAVDEIRSYETRSEGVHWYNVFMNATPATKIGGSMGGILILSAIGIFCHFLLAIYVNAVRPGKYGAAKHPLYFLKFFKSKENDEIAETDETDNPNFETTPEGLYTPGIQIRNLKKTYNVSLFSRQKVHALRGVTVDFYKGQMTSLLGHNGAGKTTMISILTGMTSPNSGTVLIDSKDLKKSSSEIMQDMGHCTQEDIYFSSLSVSQQLMFFATLKRKNKPKSAVREDVNDLLRKLKLDDKKNALPDTLSGGQKRRVCLGMALVGDSSTLILDEPTSGLDPESRRVVWDILLKMRGQKTIIISTHDMEEADILGDRIAIMHTGQLKSCGTSLFLKRLIGQNNVEITLSIEPRSDPDKIRSTLHREGVVVKRDASKMVVKIPKSPSLPDSLDSLEKNKKDLGVSGFSVALVSLEEVFLKMTQDNDGPRKPQQSDVSEHARVKRCLLCVQAVRALFSKKLSYTLKNYWTILAKILIIILAALIVALITQTLHSIRTIEQESIDIRLNMYHEPAVLYTSHDGSLGNRYKSISQSLGGNPTGITDTYLEAELLRRGIDNLVWYNNYLIAAAEFNETAFNAFYSEKARFSLPISINLLWNTIIQNLLSDEYSVSLSIQAMHPKILTYDDWSGLFGFGVSLVFAFLYFSMVVFFVGHPHHENVNGVKQLQKMTGVSGLTYWGTMFVFDLIEYAALVGLVIGGFVIGDTCLGYNMYGPAEIKMEVILLLLFGINTLPFQYIFAFSKRKSGTIIAVLTVIPIIIVIVDIIMGIAKAVDKNGSLSRNIRPIQKTAFLLVPCYSFYRSQLSFFSTAEKNARCHRLPNEYYDSLCEQNQRDVCCSLGCYDGKCKRTKSFFDDVEQEIRMETCVMYLYATPMLYFVILALMECQFVRRIFRKRGITRAVDPDADELVQQEKSMIFERIQTMRGNRPSSISNGQAQPDNSSDNHVFLVYELRKSYGRLKAVKDVSFGVNRQECFGLLGVNGAGKSTTFRMMTGGEVPDHGVMYLGDKDFNKNEKAFLSQMGYCPQHSAILECLNSYDHLYLFARLRGIPEKHVKKEVHSWIERLNLKACASQPSETYSGGNKRRLNIAIALIGDPNLILMDEPTTGVDPAARRSLWNVIKACQLAGQSVVLTSHSMDECEALCDRLAIMVAGKLVCIGASEQLKQRFGAGYDIQIRLNPEKAKDQIDSIKDDMARSLNCVLSDENLNYLKYHVASNGTTWRKMYDVMNGIKKKYDAIDDFLVLSSSLERLFLLFANTASRSPSS